MATENQANKSKRDLVRERVGKNRPDVNMDDEEAVYGAISDDYDHYDQENGRLTEENGNYKKREQQFADWITSGENNGEYFEGMMNGEDLFEVAARIHGYDALLEYLQSDEARNKYKKASEAFEAKKEENSKLEAECEKNLDETNSALSQAVDEGRFSEDDAKNAIEGLLDICDGLKVNVCKPEWIEMWLKANNYDSDIEASRKEGYTEGMNEGVDKQMRQRKSNRGAGKTNMPVGAGGANQSNKPSGGSLAQQLMGM